MQKFDGPFASSHEAWPVAQKLNAQLGGVARIAGVNYWVMSDV
jgi:hypothetical protein